MRKSWFLFAVPVGGAMGVASVLGVTAAACSSSGNLALPYQDGAPDRTEVAEASTTVDSGIGEASSGTDAGDGAVPVPPSRLLLTYEGPESSEIVAFGMQSKQVDGRLEYADKFGATYVGTTAPWLLGAYTSQVGLLDGQNPWRIDAAWNVQMNDLTDAGYTATYADPQAVIAGPNSQAYVLRYTRNEIAVISTAPGGALDGGVISTPEGGIPLGVPVAPIDLSGEVQVGGDGYVQPIAGVYVASAQRLYVLLGNIDRSYVLNGGYNLGCAPTTPTIIAIDTANNSLIDLNGSAAGHGWPLVGYNPLLAPGALAYDPSTGTSGRLLVVETGCNEAETDGGLGPFVKAEIESIDLATGSTSKLLDLTQVANYPAGLTYVNAHEAIVLFYGSANLWDPTTTTLGAAIPNAPNTGAVYDGNGNLLGLNTDYGTDGGVDGVQVVSVAIADGGVTTLSNTNPFTLTGEPGPTGVTLWPAP